jgi:hypothetical protein
MAKSKKNKNKPKLNLTVREEQRNKLEQMAPLENRSVFLAKRGFITHLFALDHRKAGGRH